MVVAGVALFGFTGVTLLVVLFFQRSQGLTQLETGLRLLPEMGAFVVASAVTGRLVRRIGFTVPLAAGLAVAGLASVALLAAAPPAATSDSGSRWPHSAPGWASSSRPVPPLRSPAWVPSTHRWPPGWSTRSGRWAPS